MTTAALKAAQGEKTTGKALAVTGLAILALLPFATLLIPAVQEWLAGALDVLAPAAEASYDPAMPLEPSVSAMPTFWGVLGGMVVLVVLALLSVLLVSGAAHFLSPRDREDFAIGSGVFGVGAGFILTIGVFSAAVYPLTEASQDEKESPAQIAQWVEGRYDLSLDASTAKALVNEARNGGDPVLIEGRLLNLTRVAQGGYVLTEDGSATELPTIDKTENAR